MLSRINKFDKEKLIELFDNLIFDKHFQYVSHLSSTDYSYFADTKNDRHIEFISKRGDEIVGYMFAQIDGQNSKIAQISNCVNFTKSNKLIFGKDLRSFMKLLTANGIKKIEWAVWEGNPAKDMYDKIKNVRYVGYYTNAINHCGKEINLHLYELFLPQRATDGEQ